MNLIINDLEYAEQINTLMNILNGIETAAESAVSITNDLIENYFVAEKVDAEIYEKLEMIEKFASNLKLEYENCHQEAQLFLDEIEENDKRARV